MGNEFVLVVIVISLALLFDFLNGFHDAANSIATIVVTRALTPFQAVLMAGFGNFIGYFLFGIAIAKMIGQGIIQVDYITLHILMAALMGAVIWNIITWFFGLPTSSSHALIGGLIGSGVASAGFKVVMVGGVLKIASFIILAPLFGMIGAQIFTIAIMKIFRKSHPVKVNNIFNKLQFVSALFVSIGHGTNDAQKSMGIIALALFSGGIIKTFHVDSWVILSCYSAIALGTICGGWRIIKTMGSQITKIRSMEGFCSGAAASLVMLGTAQFGIPVSTTHVIAGSIMGVGSVQHAAKVRWITARKIMWAWFMTIPFTAICSALSYFVFSLFISK